MIEVFSEPLKRFLPEVTQFEKQLTKAECFDKIGLNSQSERYPETLSVNAYLKNCYFFFSCNSYEEIGLGFCDPNRKLITVVFSIRGLLKEQSIGPLCKSILNLPNMIERLKISDGLRDLTIEEKGLIKNTISDYLVLLDYEGFPLEGYDEEKLIDLATQYMGKHPEIFSERNSNSRTIYRPEELRKWLKSNDIFNDLDSTEFKLMSFYVFKMVKKTANSYHNKEMRDKYA